MDGFVRMQIVWSETLHLRVPEGGDPTALAALRQLLAGLAEAAPAAFTRFEGVPALDDSVAGADVAACSRAAAVPDTARAAGVRVILWPSADGKTLQATGQTPPAPWASLKPEEMTLLGRFRVEGEGPEDHVCAFAAPAGADPAPRFVSIVTGTGLPEGTPVHAPRAAAPRKIPARTGRLARNIAIAAVLVFALACYWSASIGSATRAAEARFPVTLALGDCATPASLSAGIDATKLRTVFGVPENWMATGDSVCVKGWQAAIGAAQAAADAGWMGRAKQGLADLTLSDSGTSYSLVLPTLLTMLALLLLSVSAGLGVLGQPMGLFIDGRNRLSLTRMQFGIWLVIIMGGLTSAALYNVGFRGGDLHQIRASADAIRVATATDRDLAPVAEKLGQLFEYVPEMDGALWALIGISAGTTALSSVIVRPGGGQRRTRVLTNRAPSDAALSDLVFGETEGNDGVVDANRVQAIAITGLLAAVYLSLILEAAQRLGGLTAIGAVNAGRQVFAGMPPTGETFLLLLAASHGSLLTGKLFNSLPPRA